MTFGDADEIRVLFSEAILPVGSIRQASLELLRFGAQAEVLEPPELRARMAELAGEMGRIYQP